MSDLASSTSPSSDKKNTRLFHTSTPLEGLPLLYTSAQVEAYLAMDRATFCILRRSGKGPRHIKVGKRIMYYASDVEAWLKSHVVDVDPA